MQAWTEAELHTACGEALRRAKVDRELRALALEDPVAAVLRVSQRTTAPVEKFHFVESEAGRLDVVFATPSVAFEELSEDELEEVAGGGSNPPVTLSY